MVKVMKMEGTFFEHSVTGTKSKILTFVNFFCVFSTSFVPWYKKPKSLDKFFFRVHADVGVYFMYTNDAGRIIRSQYFLIFIVRAIRNVSIWSKALVELIKFLS